MNSMPIQHITVLILLAKHEQLLSIDEHDQHVYLAHYSATLDEEKRTAEEATSFKVY